MLAVVHYGMGNLLSVINALDSVGAVALVAEHPEDLQRADAIILPGVGAFGDGMQNLAQTGMLEALHEEVRVKGKPFLGLCLGMQLLATVGFEHGEHQGLDWIPGEVRRIGPTPEAPDLRVPHIGWNSVRVLMRDRLYYDLGDCQDFYFVHSYVLVPTNPRVQSGVCTYGRDFTASVEVDNICGTQFHPEKSQRAGLAVLRNWLVREVQCLRSA